MLLWLLTATVVAAPWRFSNPRPHGNNIVDMLFLDGTVWQVGDRGQIYTSSDLDLWLPQSSGTTKSLRAITAFSGKIYISGEAGTIVFGPDPRTLKVQELGTEDWLEGIAASTNVLVAVGDNGAIYSSADGQTWNRRGAYATWLRSVAFGFNEFVAVGEDGFIATSTDGIDWQERVSGTTAHLNRVTWLNDRFWIVGDEGTLLTNVSQMTFKLFNAGVTNALFTVSGNSNEVVLAGDGIVLKGPPDGSDWTVQSDSFSPLLAPQWPYYSSLWDGRLFLLGGRTGMIVEGFRTNELATLNWYSSIQPTRSWLWSLARPSDFYIAVGANGTIVTSDDGIEWFREAPPALTSREVLLGVGGNPKTLITVGSHGTLLRSAELLTNVITTNLLGEIFTNVVNLLGVDWQEVSLPVTNDLQGVAIKDELGIVTGGNGTILTSVAPGLGIQWIPQSSGVSSFLSGATAWPGGFVVVGDDGVILTSEDGIRWTRRTSPVKSWIYSVRYVGERLIAVGENGVILTSTDGIDWQQRASGTSEWLNDVTFAQGRWYVAASGGLLITSLDGAQWTVERSITSKSLYGAATDGTQVVIAGMEGVILRKNLTVETTPVAIETFDNAGFSSIFLFTGKVDQQFVLEASDSVLGPWRPAAFLELTDPGGTALYELPNGSSPTQLFRTRLL